MRQQPFASPEGALEHFGIKGMKWGVRKEKPPKEKIKSFFQESIVGTTKNGDQFSVIPVNKQDGPLMQALARRFERHRTLVENSAVMDIRDKQGKSIGSAQVYRKSKDELNLVWLDIEQSHRGQGYAQAVMRSAKNLGGEQGFKKLTLEVPGVSPDARHIYEKQGFKVIKEPSAADKTDIWRGLTHMEYRYGN
jgi:ribosomal protein S18 acetylase RimI-like enzyme